MAGSNDNNEQSKYHFDPIKMGKLFQMVETMHEDVHDIKVEQLAQGKIIAPIPKSVNDLNTKVGIQNGRVSKLEKFRYLILGAFGLLLFGLKYWDKLF